ncbi:hypothetical protein [Aureibacter tunicatorum]|uniref:Tetratricopeptide (TPR) repeat protein n=1 Tax=Aureibacter tunicatorum TaxID=866807 RepID=A0AAE3XQ56_9BACT|nr:hypothetical protein [Aureibacter tunicatorum]MDR6240532.1 tetratricopeptide (TPR) repeat protein [Aureibacter tunicatorum]BDD06607.1 hypothetical protein AUTU_40900 [Aureibacter tunicatorum]
MNRKDWDKIISFHDGEMSPQDQVFFMQELEKKIDLKREYELSGQLVDVVWSSGVRENIISVHQEIIATNSNRFSFRNIAASISLIFMLFYGWYSTLNTDQVYFNLYEENQSRTFRSIAVDNLEVNSVDSNNQYWKQILNNFHGPDGVEVEEILLAGVAALELNQPDYAIDIFKYIDVENNEWGEIAEWHLGLAYLKIENFESALRIFNKIHQDVDHAYHGKVSNFDLFKILMIKSKK